MAYLLFVYLLTARVTIEKPPFPKWDSILYYYNILGSDKYLAMLS